MQNFTRGKWQYTILPSKKKTLTGNDFLIFTGSPDPKENGIDIALASREADARLIAAAPDMYKFIKAIYELCTDPDDNDCGLSWRFIPEAAQQILTCIDGDKQKGGED